MSRVNWKPIFLHPEFMYQQKKVQNQEDIVLTNRATVLTKQMIGAKLHIYNGIRFFPLLVTSEMLGHRVGEFAPTRKKLVQKKKFIKKQK
jgi:ribosomal protein S19